MEECSGAIEQAAAQDLVSEYSQSRSQELFFRTRPCKFFAAGKCKRGKLCTFAHGETKVQPLPDFYKTRFCIGFVRTGSCSKGQECSFAHSKSEIRLSVQPNAAASRVTQWRSGNHQKDKENALSQPIPSPGEEQAEAQSQVKFASAPPAMAQVLMNSGGHATATALSAAKRLPAKPQFLPQTTDKVQFQSGLDQEEMMRPKKAPLMKVDMCKFFLQGMCMRGTSCTFAHSASELQQRPNFYRTMPCFKFMKEGKCSPDCKYKHSMHKDQKGDGDSSEDLGSIISFSRQSTADNAWPARWSRQSTTDHTNDGSSQDIMDGHDLNFNVKNTFLVFQDQETTSGNAMCRSHSV